MPLFKLFREQACVAGIWKTEESLEELGLLLPDPGMYREDLSVLKSPARKVERLAVRVLLYRLLGEQKQILYRADGSPYLSDGSFEIGISHTQGYVAVIVGKSPGIGIDIEQYGQKVRRVASRFMREDETVSIYRESDLWSLLLHWSAKETMFKALHCRQVDFKEHLFVLPFRVAGEGTFTAREYKTSFQYCFTIRYLIHPGFVMTWTCGEPLTIFRHCP